jgi:hypothetical protein
MKRHEVIDRTQPVEKQMSQTAIAPALATLPLRSPGPIAGQTNKPKQALFTFAVD